MKALIETRLFALFTSYVSGQVSPVEDLIPAYDQYATLLEQLAQQDIFAPEQLRCLFYTRIELKGLQEVLLNMQTKKNVMFEVYLNKAISLIEAEIQITKEFHTHKDLAPCIETTPQVPANKKQGSRIPLTLTWNSTDNDLIELVAALMSAGVISCEEGRKVSIADVIRAFEQIFHTKINALYTKRGKVFDRSTDTTPFIDSLRKSYNRMIDERLG